MLSRRFGPWHSKRLRIPGKQLDFWAPAYSPETAMCVRYSKIRMTAPDIWILLGYYGSLILLLLELLVLTTAGVLLHAFVLLQLCRSVLAPPASGYFGDSMTDENCYSRKWLRLLRHLHRLNTFGFQRYLVDDPPQSKNGTTPPPRVSFYGAHLSESKDGWIKIPRSAIQNSIERTLRRKYKTLPDDHKKNND